MLSNSLSKARLIETGAKKLTQLYTKLVAEGSSGSPPVSGLAFMLTEFPPPLMSSLTPLVVFLRTLPLPSTHPSHPAASAILNTLKDAQRGYADMRGNWSRKALEMHSRRVVDRAETLDGVAAGKEFSIWIDNLLKVTEVLLLVIVFILQILSRARTHRQNTPSSPNSPRWLATLSLHRLMIPFLLHS
jgi:exocyst complex protein 7